MDNERFKDVCDMVIASIPQREGIGTLSEKTLHAVLKHYFDPNTENHEIKVGTYFADICNSDGIIEIQTKQFNKLRNKLQAFLCDYKVTIVYPIASHKWLHWIDQETGCITKGRRSPKKGNPCQVFPELYKIKQFLNHDNFKLTIVMTDIEEYRFLNGWSKDRKKGSHCSERIPIDLTDEIHISCTRDYSQFIPENLISEFTSKDYAKASHIPLSIAQTALNILFEVNVVKRIGKKGNAFIYARNFGDSPRFI